MKLILISQFKIIILHLKLFEVSKSVKVTDVIYLPRRSDLNIINKITTLYMPVMNNQSLRITDYSLKDTQHLNSI